MATRDNLPWPNCNSDGKAENKRQTFINTDTRHFKIQTATWDPPWQGLNTRGILNFRAKGIIYFGPLKTKWIFLYICLCSRAVNEFLLLVLYECTSQSGLKITAGQRTMSGLIADLTGQTLVLPVIFAYEHCCFALKPSKKKNASVN